uniref:Uncharacterized protein LOC104213746 n=1 Tax=Nicotiana sylvestris TaxID=4096 RepID=A0A1U7V009_NICSY|nr:PREDICTED: uncharacterized protein LOC104213746 [Nicotiana sylvestris]
MFIPQDHPGTPHPPSPSNSSSTTPPNESPKPRFRRQKMLARKTVASGALRKGDGHGSSDSEKTQEFPTEVSSSVIENLETRVVLVGPIRDVKLAETSRSGGKKKSKKEKEREGAYGEERENRKGAVLAICGVAQERLEESGMKLGGSGSGEAAEGLVHLSKRRDEPVSSTEETLADLLIKIGATKRTRSAVKAKQAKVLDDEEWSGEEEEEEESDKEQDNCLVDSLAAQGWKDMVLQMDGRLARNELIEFMANAAVKDVVVSSLVKGVLVQFDAEKLGEILDIPSKGFDDYTRQRWPCLDSLPTALEITKRFCDSKDVNEARAVQKSEMRVEHKFVFEFVNKCLLPRQERRHTANYMDLVLMECLERGKQINWPALIVKLLDRVINGSKAHATPYGFILTTVLDRLNVPLKKWEMTSSKEHFGIKTLLACDYPARVGELETERDGLRTELAKEKEKSDGILQNMMNLFQTQPSSSSKP